MVADGEEALDLLRRMTGKPPGVRLLRKTMQKMPGFMAVQIDKRQVKCACCVGGAIIVPLGIVPLTENLMMIAMVIRMPIRMLWPGDIRLWQRRVHNCGRMAHMAACSCQSSHTSSANDPEYGSTRTSRPG